MGIQNRINSESIDTHKTQVQIVRVLCWGNFLDFRLQPPHPRIQTPSFRRRIVKSDGQNCSLKSVCGSKNQNWTEAFPILEFMNVGPWLQIPDWRGTPDSRIWTRDCNILYSGREGLDPELPTLDFGCQTPETRFDLMLQTLTVGTTLKVESFSWKNNNS